MNSNISAAEARSFPGKWKRLEIRFACALLLVLLAWLYAPHHDFPFFYHPDEPDKVDQVITQKWNFHHPLLMLGTAELVRKALGVPDREQQIVVVGRWVSTVFALGGATAFAWLGFRMRGARGLLAGALLGVQHQVYELAHYFKEDTALFFAAGLAFVALHFYWKQGGAAAAAAIGAACGLCAAAKYLGAVMLIPAVLLLVTRRGCGREWTLLFAAFAAAFLLIDWPMLARLEVFRHSFGRETELLAQGEHALSGQRPFFEYLRIFVSNTNLAIWLLLIAEIAVHWRQRRQRDAFDWLMLLFPFAFTLLLSCSTKTNDRYFLPATAGFYFLAALGAADLPVLLPRVRGSYFAAASVALIFTATASRSYFEAFGRDDRAELLAWIRNNVPPGATIAAEDHADLPVVNRKERLQVQPLLPQKVIQTKYVADLGASTADLTAQGIDYIVISESDYGLFFRRAAAHLSPEMQRKKDFYETLFRGEKPLLDFPRGTVIYLHPGLRLYRVSSSRDRS